MKNAVLSMLTVGAIAFSFVGCNQNNLLSLLADNSHHTITISEQPKLVCQKEKDPNSNQYIPATYAWTPQRKKAIVLWKSQYFKASGYDPQKRCQEASPRFDKAYQNGRLNGYITRGKLNKIPVICAVNLAGKKCNNSNLLITLRPGDNSQEIIDHLQNTLSGNANSPLEHTYPSSPRLPKSTNINGQEYYKVDFKF